MHEDASGPTLGNRWPELLVSGLLVVLALLIIVDSRRVGTGWADDGPQSGYFPFYIGLLLLASSGWVLVTTLMRWSKPDATFAEISQLRLVVAMLVPMLIYVALIFVLGIYLPSALMIAYFMIRYGKYRWLTTLPVAVGVPLVFFLVFERWFLVPLPKGPIEQMMGL